MYKQTKNSVSLDPDEDKRDTTIFDGLKNFMLNEMSDEDCQYFKTVTLRNLAKRAQTLKAVRPPRGLSFSLQQQRMSNSNLFKSKYTFIAKLNLELFVIYRNRVAGTYGICLPVFYVQKNVCFVYFRLICLCSFFCSRIADKVKLNYDLVAALLANAFFSTFPKRTEKTHPTLVDFNFSHFFRNLHE